MKKNYQCKRCPRVFENRSELYYHFLHNHTQRGRGQHPHPWGEEQNAPWMENGKLVDKELKKIYSKYSHLILRRSYALNNSQGNWNWPIENGFTLEQLMGFVDELYKEQKQTFKLNLAFGFILKEKVTGELRYFIPFSNEAVLSAPIYISRYSDLGRLKKQLARLDITQYVQNRRPGSNWVPHLITNVTFMCTMTDFPLGGALELPQYLKNKRSLLGLTRSYNGSYEYTDQLCLFRALAAFKQPQSYRNHANFEESVSFYYQQYRENTQHPAEIPEDEEEFEGFNLQMLPDFEKVFQLNVEIFQLSEEDVALPIYKSTRRYPTTMHLNLWENHLSLILKLNAFAKKFQCRSCSRLFHLSIAMKRHEGKCKSKKRISYPGGYYSHPTTIFEELAQHGIVVPEEDRYNEHFCVYDFESYLETVEDERTPKVDWLQKHNPISVSVCSTLPDFTEPKCFIDENPKQLLALMIDYMLEIQGSYQALSSEKWGGALEQLEELVQKWTPQEEEDNGSKKRKRKRQCIESDDESDDTLVVRDAEDFTETIQKAMLNKLRSLLNRFQKYMSQMCAIGYNSSKYDIPLNKAGLAQQLGMEEDSDAYTIKCGNAYKCIATGDLKFIDIMSFLPPGTSYKKFLQCYSIDESKSWFPYDWFKSSDLLDYPRLPDFEEFYSPLKGRNVLEEPEEQAIYDKQLQKWIVKFSEAMVKQKDIEKVLDEKPKAPDTARERYQKLQDIWTSRGFTKFSQFLAYYNNLDTQPMCYAITKMLKSYREEGIDLLQSAVSIPGIARQMLFKSAAECGATFTLFDKANSDLHRTFLNNLVGGPSIIFNRYHKVDHTFIRGNKDKPCKALIGEDANG